MAMQNIYDNETFFEGYRKIRENKINANTVFEIPALFSQLPDLHGKTVLDLGCGFGEHCIEYVKMGAERVTGIDISEKMLEVARKENSDPKIEYLMMPMENLATLGLKADVVISSLAFHYVQDFSGVIKAVHALLEDGGVFVFSQENPLCTCHSGGDRWTRDANGNKLYLNLKDYSVEGERNSTWFVENVQKYHRMFSTIVNTLIESGFCIEKMIEPVPDEALLAKYPQFKDLSFKPDFLIIRARKTA